MVEKVILPKKSGLILNIVRMRDKNSPGASIPILYLWTRMNLTLLKKKNGTSIWPSMAHLQILLILKARYFFPKFEGLCNDLKIFLKIPFSD